MKHLKALLVLLMLQFSCLASYAQSTELSNAARQFRTSILSFLREEGFTPTTSNDGKTVNFKREGQEYWITLSGSMPVQVNMHIEGFGHKDANLLAILIACNEVNKEKYYVKAYVDDFGDNGSTNLAIEIPCHTAEDFKYVFFDCVRSLAVSRTQLQEEYNQAQESLNESNKPFEIISCSVANVDKNNKVLTNYGNTIYSYSSRYLKPRIEIKNDKYGKYTIYYKLYTPDGTLSTGTSSPKGYSTSGELTVYSGTQTYELPGWGSDTSGHWKAGDYRYEFYCNGASLGYYNFTIK